MYVEGGSTVSIYSCTFNSNEVQTYGGAIVILESFATFKDATIRDNRGLGSVGAAVSLISSSEVTMQDVMLEGNSCAGYAGTANIADSSSLTCERCEFRDNIGSYGVVTASSNARLTLSDCAFVGNSARSTSTKVTRSTLFFTRVASNCSPQRDGPHRRVPSGLGRRPKAREMGDVQARSKLIKSSKSPMGPVTGIPDATI